MSRETVFMQVGLGEKTIKVIRPLAGKVHPWALRLIGGLGAGRTGAGVTVVRLLRAQGIGLFRLPTVLIEPVA